MPHTDISFNHLLFGKTINRFTAPNPCQLGRCIIQGIGSRSGPPGFAMPGTP